MGKRASPFSSPKRYVGGYIPLELFEAFEAARGERGIGNRTEAIAKAIAYWVEHNPPSTGLPRVIAEVLSMVSQIKAARTALDDAIAEWRVSRKEELLVRITELSAMAGLELPADVKSEVGKKRTKK